jgi:hypothetical protein
VSPGARPTERMLAVWLPCFAGAAAFVERTSAPSASGRRLRWSTSPRGSPRTSRRPRASPTRATRGSPCSVRAQLAAVRPREHSGRGQLNAKDRKRVAKDRKRVAKDRKRAGKRPPPGAKRPPLRTKALGCAARPRARPARRRPRAARSPPGDPHRNVTTPLHAGKVRRPRESPPGCAVHHRNATTRRDAVKAFQRHASTRPSAAMPQTLDVRRPSNVRPRRREESPQPGRPAQAVSSRFHRGRVRRAPTLPRSESRAAADMKPPR